MCIPSPVLLEEFPAPVTRQIPINLLTRDIDIEAGNLLTPDQLREYRERTAEARLRWETRKANYKHLSSPSPVFGKHDWRDLEAKTAAYFLEFRADLWTVFMSIRVRDRKAL